MDFMVRDCLTPSPSTRSRAQMDGRHGSASARCAFPHLEEGRHDTPSSSRVGDHHRAGLGACGKVQEAASEKAAEKVIESALSKDGGQANR
jgi:hypothetical protein